MSNTKTAIVSISDGFWTVNGNMRGWTDRVPFYVVYYALRFNEGYACVVRS